MKVILAALTVATCVAEPQLRGLQMDVDECTMDLPNWPCPGPAGPPDDPEGLGVVAFCVNSFPQDFGYACYCLPGFAATPHTADGTVIVDGVEVPSFDGGPLDIRPARCDPITTGSPSLTPSGSPAPSETVADPSPAPSMNICTRQCTNEGEACLETESRLTESGQYKCTCLPGFTNTANQDACRPLTDEEVIQQGACDICGTNALNIIINGNCDCTCPVGFVGGAFTACLDPTTPAPTDAPTDPPSAAPDVSDDDNSTRRALSKVLRMEDKALMEGPNPCDKIDATMGDDLETRKACREFEAVELDIPTCDDKADIVPKILHSVSHTSAENFHHQAIMQSNPEYKFNTHDDASALEYVKEHCGAAVAEAYSCMAPSAYRADIFRFCALYAEGGLYLDDDLFPLVPLKELYSPCSSATVGHDFPRPLPAKQMKILSGVAGAPIFKCMLDSIVDNVKDRLYPESDLLLTGPALLQKCFEKYADDVAVTYKDSKKAVWPYSGMRSGEKVLAYEIATAEQPSKENYANLFLNQKVYNEDCMLNKA